MVNMHPFNVPWLDSGVAPIGNSLEGVSAPQLSPAQLQELHSNLSMHYEGLNNPSMGDTMMLESNNEWFDNSELW